MKTAPILTVEICEAKPNPLFTEEQRQWVRFLRYNRWIPCAECGKKRKVMWTMLCQFRAVNLPARNERLSLVARNGRVSHTPLTPVCGAHPIGPDVK